ncbi:MAG: hypothetical protein JWO94_2919, partial [Verrucomicrobiaceae bacterium]|nr:hypothetical protein [Verrucomicrobiaceae bacterium]
MCTFPCPSRPRLSLAVLALVLCTLTPAQAARPDHVAQVDLVPGLENTFHRSAVVDPVAKLLYTGASNYAITVSDLTTNLAVAQIPVPNYGILAMAVDPASHRLFAVAGAPSLFIIDTVSRAVTTTVTLPSGFSPTDLAYDAGLGRIYISSSSNAGGVAEIDATAPGYTVLRTLTTGPNARSVDCNPSTHAVYATSAVSANDSNSTEICFFDPASATPTSVLPLTNLGNTVRYVPSVDRLYVTGTNT